MSSRERSAQSTPTVHVLLLPTLYPDSSSTLFCSQLVDDFHNKNGVDDSSPRPVPTIQTLSRSLRWRLDKASLTQLSQDASCVWIREAKVFQVAEEHVSISLEIVSGPADVVDGFLEIVAVFDVDASVR